MDAPPPVALDAALRAADPDRWLSSRFVSDPAGRARLVALYTLDNEWRRVARAVTTPLAGEIRLAWWSEALDRFAAGGAAEHPALAALGPEAARALSPPLHATIEARRQSLEEHGSPPAAEQALASAAARLLDPEAPASATDDAALAWTAALAGDAVGARSAFAAARRSSRALSPAAFPALAHMTLARAYALGRSPGPLEKRLRITWAVLSGRI